MIMDEKKKLNVSVNSLVLSDFTKALIHNLKLLKKRSRVEELSKISVSKTVSFFALVYEKVRNAVEYRDEHLIRRAAIERILKRRLLLNPEGKGEAENVVRELLWARYFSENYLSVNDIDTVQSLIDKYVQIRNKLTVGQINEKKIYYSQFLLDILTSEIEETLDSFHSKKTSLFTSYIYQILRQKIKIENVKDDQKDAFVYVAIEKAFAKSDNAYLRYHLFTLLNNSLTELNTHELDQFITKIPLVFEKIDSIINNQSADKLSKYVKGQIPPFSILFSVIEKNFDNLEKTLMNKDILWTQVDQVCREKYQLTGSRLRNLAIRSIIYIFLTKMVFALILEYPLSLYFYNEVNYTSIAINSIFPPLLMFFIVSFVKVPGSENTKRIFDRIIDILDADTTFESSLAYVLKKARVRKPILIFGFTVFYSVTFVVTFILIYEVLTLLNFNAISQIIFIFFVSVVSFFGYRVRQIAKEYQLKEKEGFFTPFVDFFFMPILALGKFFSTEIARLNFFIVILDFLIEAPFKLIFEIVEEWITFVRARKDEIV